MDAVAELVYAVEAAPGGGAAGADVEAVVGEAFAGEQLGLFADDLVALDDEFLVVFVLDDPLAPEELHGAVGGVFDGEKVDEDVRGFRRDVGAAVLVAEFVEVDGESRELEGSRRHGLGGL